MTWQEFENEIQGLAQQVTIELDAIIGITRGGLIPARMLSTQLNVKQMYCLSVEKNVGERMVVTTIDADLTGKTILLVEDMLETGRSLDVAKAYLENKGAVVKTACLYTMPISEFTPDYSLRQVQEVQQFPWE